jgi:fructan beta-fructosidase
MTDMAFSGSAVMDKNNTSGWGTKDAPPMVLAYTSTGRGECIAYSTDRGHSWTEYEKNPVVKHAGRDPKLVWYAPGKHWVMAVYDEAGGQRGIAFYSSPDLKTWTFQSKIDDFYECPDLFELPIWEAKGPKKTKWVLYAADGKYILGSFDGKKFSKESGKHQLWYGNFYAAQTFDNAPGGNRFQIGWTQGATFPGMPFNQQMTVPVYLSLRNTVDGIRLHAEPASKLEQLEGKRKGKEEIPLTKEPMVLVDGLDSAQVVVDFEPPTTGPVQFRARGLDIIYDRSAGSLTCGKVVAPLKPDGNGLVRLEILIDRGSIEVFSHISPLVISVAHVASAGAATFSAAGEGCTHNSFSWRPMKSAWK